MSIVVTPIPRLIDLAAPAFTLGTANAAGSAATAVASDSTLLAFDTTVPTTIAYSASAAVGSAVVTSRRDHTHGMAAGTSLQSKCATASQAAATASGDQSYTGAGFQPTAVLIGSVGEGGEASVSLGIGDSSAGEAFWRLGGLGSTINVVVNGSQIMQGVTADLNHAQTAVLKSLDADGITLTWTKAGSGDLTDFWIWYLR
jgi:hypothetical protein